jgi:hypothetical protein
MKKEKEKNGDSTSVQAESSIHVIEFEWQEA